MSAIFCHPVEDLGGLLSVTFVSRQPSIEGNFLLSSGICLLRLKWGVIEAGGGSASSLWTLILSHAPRPAQGATL